MLTIVVIDKLYKNTNMDGIHIFNNEMQQCN